MYTLTSIRKLDYIIICDLHAIISFYNILIFRQIRRAFRRICLEHLQGEFFDSGSVSVSSQKIHPSWRVALFSYLLATNQFVGEVGWFGSPLDATMKEIGELSRSSLLMKAKPRDLLHVLRPMKCIGLKFNPTSRACSFLGVSYQGWETERDGIGLHTNYFFRVNYCLRISIIKRRFSQFLDLQTGVVSNTSISISDMFIAQLSPFVFVFPARLSVVISSAFKREIPLFRVDLVGDVSHRLLIGDRNKRGKDLAQFIMNVHQQLAEEGLFSPRLLGTFLGLDSNRIHAEEERCIKGILNSPGSSEVSVWAMIDESWLTRWKYFATSRGGAPPPGRISNDALLVEHNVSLEFYF